MSHSPRVIKALLRALCRSALKHDAHPALKATLSLQQRSRYNKKTKQWDRLRSEQPPHVNLAQDALAQMMNREQGADSELTPMFYRPGGSAVATLLRIFKESEPATDASVDAAFEGLRRLEENIAMGEQLGLLTERAENAASPTGGGLSEQSTPEQGSLLMAHPLLDSAPRAVMVRATPEATRSSDSTAPGGDQELQRRSHCTHHKSAQQATVMMLIGFCCAVLTTAPQCGGDIRCFKL